MPRLSSLKYAPAEARRILRDRFARYLPITQNGGASPTHGVSLQDELLLKLLLNLRPVFESDAERARISYDAVLAKNPGGPSFDQAIADGWFRIVWGRVATPFEIDQRARAAPANTMTALNALLKNRFAESFLISGTAKSDPELADLAGRIERRETAPDSLRSRDPEWVAARLWDRGLTDSAADAAGLRLWVDRWRLLGSPSLVAHEVWSEAAANAFSDTALAVLASEPGLAGWDDTRAGFIRQISLRTSQPPASAETHIPVLPATLLGRAVWLGDLRLEGAIAGMMSANQDLVGLIRILLTDVEEQEFAAAPHPVLKQLLDIAVSRPEILAVVLFKVRWSAALVADLLLYPATCSLACWLIAQWSGPSGAWDRELRARDDQTTKAMAFADAASILGDFLEQGLLPPAEAASLLDVLYETAKPVFGDEANDDASILAILRGEIAGQTAAVQQAMFAALNASMPQSGLGSSTFAAALDVVDAADLAESVDPAPLLSAYIGSVAAGAYVLSANRTSVSAAASLVRLAMKAPDPLRQSFFAPIDVRSRIAAAAAPGVNPLLIEDEVARSLRAHIRVLCRAVAGLQESSPNELIDALIKTVRVGALDHKKKGRVGAFAARFETEPYRGARDRPIAVDLAAALSTLSSDEREKLLAAILDIDEPVVLARLIALTPVDARTRIEGRIDALTPSDAGDIRSLPEAMVRIEELLSAGRADAAAKFIEVERGLRTLGPVAGRDLAQLRISLHLKLLRHDWSGVAATEPPTGLVGQARDAALDLLNFFKGLAALSDPDGNREGAEHFFAALHQRHPHVAAYAVNLFAARISALLGTDGFTELQGPKRIRGRQVSAEAEQSLLQLRDVSEADLEIFNCNKALLLLALGQPDRAYDVLASTPSIRLRDNAAAYSAVALNRMARVREAWAVLDDAEKTTGETIILREAREHIKSGKHFAAVVSLATDDNPIRRIKIALFDLSQMDHHRQAQVLVETSEPFESLVIGHVRAAAEDVTSLVSLTNFAKTDLYEEEITALIQMPLAASVRYLGWTVIYQPPGGYSARGNTGKRDLVIEKNAWTLAVIEAVVCRNPITYESVQKDLTRHFQKLLGYSSSPMFLHLTYSYVDDPSSVFDHLKPMSEKAAPPAFVYKGSKDIPLTDSGPTGFSAEYQGPRGLVKVVFLVLDMRQHAQAEAARIAGHS